MEWRSQPRQERFLLEVLDPNGADEILYGGAAGGGKTDALLIAGIVWCKLYPGSWVLFLRRTYPELEQKPIPRSKSLIPSSEATYLETKHRWKFTNSSVLQFASLDKKGDEAKYQSSEYSLIIFDELTHFQEYQYLYLLSRNRTIDEKIKKCKIIAGTNPGNIGHVWVKSRWIDQALPEQVWECPLDDSTISLLLSMGISKEQIKPRKRCFIPAKVTDNLKLMEADPGYLIRLAELPEAERRMLLEGDWDIFAGQYFSMWRREIHVVKPFPIPDWWNRFRSLDYGLDMCSCHDWAVDGEGNEYIVNEVYKPDLIISEAAKEILRVMPGEYSYTVASPDLWNREHDIGVPREQLFRKAGLVLRKADNRRVDGWQVLAEHFKVYPHPETGKLVAKLRIFENCVHAIRTVPALIRDETDPNDVSDKCEDHAGEDLRYGAMSRPRVGVPNNDNETFKPRTGRGLQTESSVQSEVTNY